MTEPATIPVQRDPLRQYHTDHTKRVLDRMLKDIRENVIFGVEEVMACKAEPATLNRAPPPPDEYDRLTDMFLGNEISNRVPDIAMWFTKHNVRWVAKGKSGASPDLDQAIRDVALAMLEVEDK